MRPLHHPSMNFMHFFYLNRAINSLYNPCMVDIHAWVALRKATVTWTYTYSWIIYPIWREGTHKAMLKTNWRLEGKHTRENQHKMHRASRIESQLQNDTPLWNVTITVEWDLPAMRYQTLTLEAAWPILDPTCNTDTLAGTLWAHTKFHCMQESNPHSNDWKCCQTRRYITEYYHVILCQIYEARLKHSSKENASYDPSNCIPITACGVSTAFNASSWPPDPTIEENLLPNRHTWHVVPILELPVLDQDLVYIFMLSWVAH